MIDGEYLLMKNDDVAVSTNYAEVSSLHLQTRSTISVVISRHLWEFKNNRPTWILNWMAVFGYKTNFNTAYSMSSIFKQHQNQSTTLVYSSINLTWTHTAVASHFNRNRHHNNIRTQQISTEHGIAIGPFNLSRGSLSYSLGPSDNRTGLIVDSTSTFSNRPNTIKTHIWTK